MFTIETFLQKHKIEDYSVFTKERYIALNESAKLKDYFADEKRFTPEYIQMLVTIEYNGEAIIGIDGSNGLDLWEQTYETAMREYVENRQAKTMYGVDPITLKWTALDGGLLRFVLMNDWSEEIYVDATFPEKEFLEAMLTEAEHFWQVLIDYKVFEGKNKRKTTPSDYPAKRIKKIHKLKAKVRSLK